MDLQKLVKRRHPEFKGKLTHWQFLHATYQGGRDWFDQHIFRYLKEGDSEFKDRKSRAYRFNHTREIVNLVNKYVFRGDITRKKDAETAVLDFWKRTTRDGICIDEFMRQADIESSIYGRIWIVVDSTHKGEAVSKADERKHGSQTYAYVVPPTHMLDMGTDDDGQLLWMLLYEPTRDDDDPFESSGAIEDRWRLWTRNEWFLFELSNEKGPDGEPLVVERDRGVNHLGEVPVVPLDAMVCHESRYSSPALINDIAYLDRAVANYLSNLDAIIQDQTFSQLAIPAQNMMPGDKEYNQMVAMGTNRVFVFDGGEGGSGPFFLSPDVKQAHLILEVVGKIINEIYHSVGVAGERTKEDNSKGIDNSSGVAKAYDFERVNSLLASKSSALQRAENRISRLAAMYAGVETDVDYHVVDYPKSYDVRGLTDEFAVAEQLSLIDAPETVRREQMRSLIDKLFPNLTDDVRAAIEKELEKFPASPDLLPGMPPLPQQQPKQEDEDASTQQDQWTAE